MSLDPNNLGQVPYQANNYHHLSPSPEKSSSSTSNRHHSHTVTPHHHLQSSELNKLMYYNAGLGDLVGRLAESNRVEWEKGNKPLNRSHRNATYHLNGSPSATVVATGTSTVGTIASIFNGNNSANTFKRALYNVSNQVGELVDTTNPFQPTPIAAVSNEQSLSVVETTMINEDVLSGGSESSSSWMDNTDIPILIGAAVGGFGLLLVLVILLVIWNCCDTSNRCIAGKNNSFDNDRSNRASLSSSGSDHSGKRTSCNLYINNPNSIDATISSNDLGGPNHFRKFGDADFSTLNSGGGICTQLVIHNARAVGIPNLLAADLTQEFDSNSIPRSISVPLSRSNSRKDQKPTIPVDSVVCQYDMVHGNHNGSATYFSGADLVAVIGGGNSQRTRSQLNRNLATYYETQRAQSAKLKENAGNYSDKINSAILSDLSFNMDMMSSNDNPHRQSSGATLYGTNVIANNNHHSQQQQRDPDTSWLLLDTNSALSAGRLALDQTDDVKPNEFYRTRSLPWSQSNRSNKSSFSSTVPASCMDEPSSTQSTIQSGITTIGKVPFSKKRRNRMRIDSAAAIALNRSGFLGGSLDWDFNDVNRVSEGVDNPTMFHSTADTLPESSVQQNMLVSSFSSFSSQPSSFNNKRTTQLVDNTTESLPTIGGTGQKRDISSSTRSDSPDVPNYLVNGAAIVVYNERTAL